MEIIIIKQDGLDFGEIKRKLDNLANLRTKESFEITISYY